MNRNPFHSTAGEVHPSASTTCSCALRCSFEQHLLRLHTAAARITAATAAAAASVSLDLFAAVIAAFLAACAAATLRLLTFLLLALLTADAATDAAGVAVTAAATAAAATAATATATSNSAGTWHPYCRRCWRRRLRYQSSSSPPSQHSIQPTQPSAVANASNCAQGRPTEPCSNIGCAHSSQLSFHRHA